MAVDNICKLHSRGLRERCIPPCSICLLDAKIRSINFRTRRTVRTPNPHATDSNLSTVSVTQKKKHAKKNGKQTDRTSNAFGFVLWYISNATRNGCWCSPPHNG
uniref:Uncharacterized protein n=1 Tax=Anopheles minimus TaxID=112268 RepID=A0A182WMW9_9DIPT